MNKLKPDETCTKKITFNFAVSLTLPLTSDPEHPDFYTQENATSAKTRRRFELAVFEVMKRVEGDADVELIDFKIEDE